MAKIHLTSHVTRFTGWINSEWPYSLQRDGRGGLYTRRTQPYLGGKDRSHWDLLVSLAQMSGDNALYISNIDVSYEEISEALSEMLDCHFLPLQVLKWTNKKVLNAEEFLALSTWLKERGIGC